MLSSETVRQIVLEAGACAAGIATCTPVPESEVRLFEEWTASGSNGCLGYMTNYPDLRRDPGLLLDGARSIIVAAFRYPSHKELQYAPGHVHWARYAVGDDYHDVLRRRLSQVCGHLTEAWQSLGDPSVEPVYRITVDSAPMRERYWAWRAGVGIIGLNGQLIVPGIGSWVLLATIITTLPIEPTAPLSPTPEPACDMCSRCVKACPGQALDGHGGVDARRCLSCLTIENREASLPAEVAGYLQTTGRMYGCDVCQEVCPMQGADGSDFSDSSDVIPELRPREALLELTPEDVRGMDQATFSATFARSAIKRAKLAGLRRNAGSPLPPSSIPPAKR